MARINVFAYYNQLELIEKEKCIYFTVHQALYYNIEPKVPDRPDRSVRCPKAALANRTFHLQCRGDGSDSKIMGVLSEPSIYDDEATSLPQFRSFFLALALSWVGMAVVVSVGDAICFDLLGEKHQLYGRQRLWGAVGWGVFSILAGWLVDQSSVHQAYKDYSIVFYLMLAAIGPDALVSTCLNVRFSVLSFKSNRFVIETLCF